MVKRGLSFFCSFLIVFSFFCQCFMSVSASSVTSSGSHGGGGSRAEPADDQNSSDFLNVLSNGWGLIFDGEGNLQERVLTSTFIKDGLSWCCGAAGAIFTDQTFSNVNAGFQALYASYGDNVTPELLHQIFYLGKDGNLYFTDEWLDNFDTVLSEETYNNGYAYLYPNDASSQIYQHAIANISNPGLLSILSNAISGNGSPLFVGVDSSRLDLYSAVSDEFYINYGGMSYSQYLSNYVNKSDSAHSTISVLRTSGSDFPANRFSSDGLQTTSYSNPTDLLLYCPNSMYREGNGAWQFVRTVYLLSPSPISVYRSKSWAEFYQSGGTGVLLSDIAADLDGIVNSFDNNYAALQDAYMSMASSIADGSKSLEDVKKEISEMNGTLQDVADDTGDIADNTATQVSYLRRILTKLQDISSKLTYSNVVDTVTAASNLLSLIGDALDSLFDASEGAFTLLDLVSEYILDGTSSTISSVMKTVFPFSLPHDLLLIFEILSVDPQVPEVHFYFNLSRLGISYDHTYVANDFAKLAYLTRFFSSIGFVMMLINLTNKMLKK